MPAPATPTSVKVRMYCMGTGDCFVLSFYAAAKKTFTMMIDCGSCVGKPADFAPYVRDLARHVEGTIDLLVVTHEHNDHVNGFAKCREIFAGIDIKQAWFAWTEDPAETNGKARDLHNKRQRMREGFEKALAKVNANQEAFRAEQSIDFNHKPALAALDAFVSGLQVLGDINLHQPADDDEPAKAGAEAPVPGASLAGMRAIKKMLLEKKVLTKYLTPGTSQEVPELPGVKFHVLGPPLDKQYIYKDGKEGRDVYKRNFAIGEGILAMNTFANIGKEPTAADLPFGAQYVLPPPDLSRGGRKQQKQMLARLDKQAERLPDADKQRFLNMKSYLNSADQLLSTYAKPENNWRTIENEWLYTAGSLAIRLNSHLNNTSLALAVEVGEGGPVLLLPGDAEYGAESWHLLNQWGQPGKSGRPFVEDLLNRTVFYKVSHHLSYNGTALEKGIRMMNSPRLATMVTLDRTRISKQWKSTMPNHALLGELVKRCQGKCFIMNEEDIAPPLAIPTILPQPGVYETAPHPAGAGVLYKEYTVPL